MIKFLVFSVIFETTTEALWQGRFFDLPVIIFVKKDRITLSVPIILSINQWSFYKLKMYRFDNQIYISQLITSLFSYKLLFEIKKIDMRLSKTLNLKFMLMFYDSAYPTCPFDTVAKYTIYSLSHWWKDYSNSLLYLLLLCLMASKTWLKNALHFTFWDRIFTRICFIPTFQDKDSNSYYLVVATAKIKKIESVRLWTSIFWIYFFQSKLIDCIPDTFF